MDQDRLGSRFKLISIGVIRIRSDPRFTINSIGGIRMGAAWLLNAAPLKVKWFCLLLLLGSLDLTDY